MRAWKLAEDGIADDFTVAEGESGAAPERGHVELFCVDHAATFQPGTTKPVRKAPSTLR
jgi:hypothetical protein